MPANGLDPSRLAIHQISLLEQCDFRESVELFSRHGIRAVGVWYDKLAQCGTRTAAALLRDHGMTVPAVCAGGLMTARDDLAFKRSIDKSRRMIDDAAEIGSDSLVVIAGGLEANDKDIDYARKRAREGLARLVDHGASVGLPIAIEPLHPMVTQLRSVLNTLEEANDWCDEIDAGDALGIAVDVYALWWDPKLEVEIKRAGKRIIGFHLSDWLADTRDIRVDRGMLGDGVIDLAGFRRLVDATGYSGYYEIEILSARDWWQRDPNEVVEIIKARYQSTL